MSPTRAQSDFTTITPTLAATALVAATAWTVAIILACIDAAGADIPHPLIYLIATLAVPPTDAVVVCACFRRANHHRPAEIPDGAASKIWDLAERVTISRLN